MINSIDIDNWKGHDKKDFRFQEGLNIICGPNGIGKTSILDAICFSFLGDITHIGSYQNITHKDFMRDKYKETELTLEFTSPEGTEFVLKRRITPQRRATLSTGGVELFNDWIQINDYILDLYNVTREFLGRVIFLTEGDTYRYINQPPGKGLVAHIENVLGLDRMEETVEILSQIYDKYKNKCKETRSDLSERTKLSEKDRDNLLKLRNQLLELEDEFRRRSDDFQNINKKRSEVLLKTQLTKERISIIDSVLISLNKDFPKRKRHPNLLDELKFIGTDLDKDINSLNQKRNGLMMHLGQFQEKINDQKKIIELISPLGKEPNLEMKCPVCKRPLYNKMIEEISAECQRTVGKTNEQLNDINNKIAKTDAQLQSIRSKKEMVISMIGKLEKTFTDSAMPKSKEELQKDLEAIEKDSSIIDNEINAIKFDHEQISNKKLDVGLKIGKLEERVAPEKIADIKMTLKSSAKLEFLSGLLLDTTYDSINRQRREMLTPLTSELSKIWSGFMKSPVAVKLNKKCEPIIEDARFNKPFDFSQLSGGEKTALLIITQMLICRQFSNSDFMLLDEPLEHLDSQNRWSLLNFLVESTKHGFPKQLIVTTIEESYVREYSDDSCVHISRLG